MLKYWRGIILGLGVALIVGAIFLLVKKWYNMKKGLRELKNMVEEAGATDVEVDYENGSIKLASAPQFTDEKFEEFQYALSKMGLKLNVSRVEKEDANEDDAVNGSDEEHSNLKSTEKGYVNKNNQKNLGKTDQEGTDNNQYFYEMECLNCGHKYYANGTDIWQRKCPACQNGRK